MNVPHGDSPGWLEEDFLGFGATNWTNAYGAEATVDILEAQHLNVVEAKPLSDDDDTADGWVWITAQKSRGRGSEQREAAAVVRAGVARSAAVD